MSFWKIAWRSLQQRAFASSLTGLSMALGVSLVVCVIVIHRVAVRQFTQDAQGYHLIVGGGKGSPMDLVLSTVFHIGKPLYPISWNYYREFTDGKFAPYVEVAVPYCLGDSFVAGETIYRCIGTTADLFDKIQYGATDDGTAITYQFAEGRNFKTENCYEAVVGSIVAAQAGLGVGDLFDPTHGLNAEGDKHKSFKVVGVLEPTGTSNDRAVFVNMEGFYLLEGHALSPRTPPKSGEMAILGAAAARDRRLNKGQRFTPEGGTERAVISVLPMDNSPLDNAVFVDDAALSAALSAAGEGTAATDDAPPEDEEAPRGTLAPAVCYDNEGNEVTPLPEDQREVTSILVLCRQFGQMAIDGGVNKDPLGIAQAVAARSVIDRLVENIIAPVRVVLMVLTVLIVIVASVSILVSIYNSMSERAHDIAVMRALGASRSAVMLIILVESILLSVMGGVAGMVLGHGLVGLAAPKVVELTGIRLNPMQGDPWEWVILPVLVLLASLVGLLPALTAYRTDVAKSLSGVR
ncbi:MAG: FtsX-like permease family protein [Planctomycetota bacterium]